MDDVKVKEKKEKRKSWRDALRFSRKPNIWSFHSCCFPANGKEMYKNVKPLLFLIKPILFWRIAVAVVAAAAAVAVAVLATKVP